MDGVSSGGIDWMLLYTYLLTYNPRLAIDHLPLLCLAGFQSFSMITVGKQLLVTTLIIIKPSIEILTFGSVDLMDAFTGLQAY